VAAPAPPRATTTPVAVRAPVHTGDPALDRAEHIALQVLARDTYAGRHLAAPFYNSTWIRDSFAWGMIPWDDDGQGTLGAYSTSEIQYWLQRQAASGAWITNVWSGYYDETPEMIAALADSYRLTGDTAALRTNLPRAEHAWSWLAQSEVRPSAGSRFLIFAAVGPHVAADWADQVARSGYATGIEALWYHATDAMATMERALGRTRQAAMYRTFAAGIKRDVNRILWRTSAPSARNAASVGSTGHYTGWLGPRDYFELDSNYLCILYGIASAAQATAIEGFTTAHAAYLLGTGTSAGMPARTLYGDYDPGDYASIHYDLEDGAYQNAYWPSVGAMLAIAAAQTGDEALARMVLQRLAALFTADNGISEWYRQDGTPSGAANYQWPARMFLLALYDAYLGLDERWQTAAAAGRAPATVPCLGAGTALLRVQGRQLQISVALPSGRQEARGCRVSVQNAPQASGTRQS
jgi:hypothetical protein